MNLSFDSAYQKRDGKIMIWVDGQSSIIDAVPNPNYFFTSSKFIEFPSGGGTVKYGSALRTIDTNEEVRQYIFPTHEAMYNFADSLKRQEIILYESDKNPVERWMLENNHTCSDYPNRAAWDIEVDDSQGNPDVSKGDKAITAVGIFYKGKLYTWAIDTNPVDLIKEKEMLQDVVAFIVREKIQLCRGWNSREFDVPYFPKRLFYHHIQFDMNSVRWVDSSILYRYLEKNYKSLWGLDHVAKRVLGKKKPYVFRKISSLTTQERAERVGWDAQCTGEIDDKKEYTTLAIQLAKQSNLFPDKILGVNPETKLITVTPVLDQYFMRQARKMNYVLPNKRSYRRGGKFAGALVEILSRGSFENVMQFDFDSLYPNTIKAFNLAPYGNTAYLFPIIDEFLTGKRQATDKFQRWAYKILANATYGIFSSAFYRFQSVEVSEQTASNAKKIITAVVEFLKLKGYIIHLIDTDSTFIKVNSYEEREILEKLINDFVVDTFKVTNIYMRFEALWSTICFPRGATKDDAKKKYYGIVHIDKKGEVVDSFEVTGMEELRGDWCDAAKEMQDTVMKMQLAKKSKKEIIDWVEENCNKPLFAGKLDDKLNMEKSMSRKPEDYGKQVIDIKTGKIRKQPVPMHVKAFRAAQADGYVPSEMVRENRVYYMMCKGKQAKLVNMVKPGELDYDWYYTHQLCSLLYRLTVIDAIPKENSRQPSLEEFWS